MSGKNVQKSLKQINKSNYQKMMDNKNANKHEKTKKHVAGKTKVKNIHNIRSSILAKSKSKQNIKDNVKSKSKNKHIVKKHILQSSSVQKIKNNKQTVVNNSLKRLNVNKINAMLNAKQNNECNEIVKVNKKQISMLSLRERMLAKLKASRFRFLNEQLYSNDSSQSKKYFQDDPHAFYAYHEGYKQQVEHWPVNPLDVIIESINKMPKDHVIADFGCGEAKLAESVPHTVHSFDLVAVNDKVKACDMANTPLLTGRVNVVVFCLSLMGSNLRDYLLEANRVLSINGILKIAEVESRFNKIEDFIKLMSHYGFVNTWKDLSNNLFYFMDFKKTKDVLKKDMKKLPVVTLKPCLYKKR